MTYREIEERRMLIRQFKPEDAIQIADIFHAAVHETGARYYTPMQISAWSPTRPDPQKFAMMAKKRLFLVAQAESGQLLGFGDLEPDGHIDHLFCSPDSVRTGVGTRLYLALEDAARKNSLQVLRVEASESALAFFERHGFTNVGRQDLVRHGVSIHNYRMQKHLD
ncbi:GNAT family N-acetyltransferase [Asaia bogorensis]|uniref:GNAT family N-acetyltransferase n=1 Tax=Asaia bogorensis TaxID=91915 RepID=UPI0028583365|nr:GNAT family N-acetyltransferase [Asaia bogorensis]MDR6182097.1 putative acetyltransferase [Asaia bogorensis NBRC 16594]